MSWQSMRARVSGKHTQSRYYIGVKVDKRWDSFEAFLADMGERPDSYSLDRIDRTKDYGPKNCRWANLVTQNRNRKQYGRGNRTADLTHLGKTQSMMAWARELGIGYYMIRQRISSGWTVHDALAIPKINRCRKNRGDRQG